MSYREEKRKLPVSSSTPPQFPDDKRQFYVEFLEAMNRHKLPYCVSGLFALHEHAGVWRQTKDLDVFVPSEQIDRVLDVLCHQEKFETQVWDAVWLAKAWRGEHFVDLIIGMSNAVIRIDQSWVDRSVQSEVLGVPCRVLGAEELLVSKVFVVRRERFDGADVAHIIYAQGESLDWLRILDLVGDHWMMLLWSLILFRYIYPTRTAAVPPRVWDLLLSRFRRELLDPDPQASFRGSLIDENMFAIDVKEWGMENVIAQYRAEHPEKIKHLPLEKIA
jgi:Nucleotidyl transferase of unknown function (DUF2204)